MITVFVNEKATRIELKSVCEREKEEGRGWSRHLKRASEYLRKGLLSKTPVPLIWGMK